MTPYTEVELSEFYELSMKKYSFGKGLWKGIVQLVIFAAPLVLLEFPTWADMSISVVVNILVNYLKVKYTNL